MLDNRIMDGKINENPRNSQRSIAPASALLGAIERTTRNAAMYATMTDNHVRIFSIIVRTRTWIAKYF
jgi:hypothetical protein